MKPPPPQVFCWVPSLNAESYLAETFWLGLTIHYALADKLSKKSPPGAAPGVVFGRHVQAFWVFILYLVNVAWRLDLEGRDKQKYTNISSQYEMLSDGYLRFLKFCFLEDNFLENFEILVFAYKMGITSLAYNVFWSLTKITQVLLKQLIMENLGTGKGAGAHSGVAVG